MEDVLETRDSDDPWTKETKTSKSGGLESTSVHTTDAPTLPTQHHTSQCSHFPEPVTIRLPASSRPQPCGHKDKDSYTVGLWRN